GQNIDQNASNVFLGTASNSNIAQSNVQNANQAGLATSRSENVSLSRGAGSISSNIPSMDNASPSGRAGTLGGRTGAASGQSVNQSASQTVSIQNYISSQPSATLTSEQRTVITSTTEQFLTSYPTSSMFIMPVNDLDTLVPQNSANFFVLDVSRQNAWSSPGPSLTVVRIPLPSLVSSLSEIPMGKAIVVVSDNQIDSAVAMTILRMYGYNAWVAQTGACVPAGLGSVAQGPVTGYAGTIQSGSTTVSSY
ncbi:MAG TPA: hypothetical protein VN455_01735, partial [Methanotrichaceae archaeon]|nr:hypothetical protein [Methanotrichaceae archaeon]